MNPITERIRRCVRQGEPREGFWVRFLEQEGIKEMLELGVYQGDFALELLRQCPSLERYYMLDPWRHLDGWNKPANKSDEIFAGYFRESMDKTAFAAQRRVVLRGTTNERIDDIPDGSLDLAYIDADHTLRGISIDLIRVLPKVKPGGWIGGDDLKQSIWQHAQEFEPTLVFPFAVYFAEAIGAPIYALPRGQFLMQRVIEPAFSFTDLTGTYPEPTLRTQLLNSPQRRPDEPKKVARPPARASLGARLLRRFRR